ncbi:Hypothetical_protein [Hexamita inflata]|uniref:Hypothetical_protein n=1 Tax=Hexamita inflata TaxID=28002 RepID=A0ABP1GV28_9EUKA
MFIFNVLQLYRLSEAAGLQQIHALLIRVAQNLELVYSLVQKLQVLDSFLNSSLKPRLALMSFNTVPNLADSKPSETWFVCIVAEFPRSTQKVDLMFSSGFGRLFTHADQQCASFGNSNLLLDNDLE